MANNAYALNPAGSVAGVIDWTSTIGMNIDKRAPKALHTEKFSGKADDLQLFLKMFKMRGAEFGWFTTEREPAIGMIAQRPGEADTEVYDLIEYYGTITREEIAAHAAYYMFTDDSEASLRARQDDHLAFRCLTNSLEQGVLRTVLLKESKFLVSDPQDEDITNPSAMLLLKTIIEESTIQTNATTAAIRTRLASLSEYMAKIGSDIPKFNQYVEENMAALAARGEESSGVLVNLWKAYKKADDKQFADFMKRQCEAYEMSNEDMTPKALMSIAIDKYRLMKEAGEWKEPSDEEKTILALKAQISQLKKAKQGGSGKKTGRTQNDKKKSHKKSEKKPDALQFHKAPSDLTKTMEWNGNTYHWCCPETGGKCDGKWRIHLPKDCQGKEYTFKRKENDAKDKEGDPKKAKKTPILRAVAALAGNESGTDSDE